MKFQGINHFPNRVAREDRERRIRWLAECAESLLRGELPPPESRLFVAGGIQAWLAGNGDLLRECWAVLGEQGCTLSPPRLWSSMSSSGRKPDNEDSQKIDTPTI